MKAVVLAAGEGVRLRPLTLTRPKHLLPVGGKPLIVRLLEALRSVGIREAVLVTYYKADMLKNYLKSGESLGMSLEYVSQRGVLGTADAVLCAEEHVRGESFLVVYGDLLVSPEAVRRVVEDFRKGGASASMAVVEVERPWSYGVVSLEEGSVKAIVEKPPKGREPSNLANAGVYVFSEDVFRFLKRTGKSVRGEYELTDTITAMVEDGLEVRAVEVDPEDWMDVGYPWSLLEANERVLKGLEAETLGEVEEGAVIKGPVYVGEGARVRSGAYIEGPVYIGPGADVGPNCYIRRYTSLGARVRVGNACEIKNSIVMDGTHIAHLSYVGDSVIGERCNFGAGTLIANLRFDDRPVKVMVKDRLVDSGRRKLGVIMGDEVKTGVNVSIMPGVKVGPRSWIAAGLTVYRDVPPDTFLRGGAKDLGFPGNLPLGLISVEDVKVDGLKAVGLKVELPESPPLVLVIAKRGFLMCGYMNRETAGKLRTPVAVVTGVSTVEEALRAEVEWVNEAAEERGIRVGMKGTEAVKLMF